MGNLGKFWIAIVLLLSLSLSGCVQPQESVQNLQSLQSLQVEKKQPSVTRVLVLGRDRAVGLTDSILLVSVKEPENQAAILQIPRDTYADYADQNYKKLNGAYQTLKTEKLKRFLSDALGVEIHYTVAIDLDCVSEAVDAVGGVDVLVPMDMDYSDPAQNLEIHLKSGRQHLNGKQAEEFVRFRSGYANADLGRMDAQKEFIKGLMQASQQLSGAGRTALALRLLSKVSTDMPVQEVMHLCNLWNVVSPEEIKMATAPGEPVQGNSGAWYYVLKRNETIGVLNEYCFPETPVTEENFDRERKFDRPQNPAFHRIYNSSGG